MGHGSDPCDVVYPSCLRGPVVEMRCVSCWSPVPLEDLWRSLGMCGHPPGSLALWVPPVCVTEIFDLPVALSLYFRWDFRRGVGLA